MTPRRTSRSTPRAAQPDMIAVEYAQLGQPLQSVTLAPGATVGDFRDSVSLADNIQIKRNGTVVDDDTELADGDRLFLNPKRVSGGSL